ncbi:glutamate synthase subunit beta [Flavobacteriaceae bacterium MHTCC 0001]
MRKLYGERPVEKRIRDNNEIFITPLEEDVLKEAHTCLNCGISYCAYSCPLGSDIDIWVGLMQKKKYKEAFNILQLTNPFPEFTGRLCHSPCEPACVNAINGYPTSIKELEKFLADMAIEKNWITVKKPKSRTKYKIAIVGSGPAGLSAANALNQMGHNVIVYERDKDLGGMLRYAIPEFRLPKRLIDFRTKLLEKEGVSFFTEKYIGRDVEAEKLIYDNDIVLLSIGASVRRMYPIPGSDLKGVVQGLDFLKCYQKKVMGFKLNHTEEELMDLEGKNIVVLSNKVDGWIGAVNRLNPKKIDILNILSKEKGISGGVNPDWPKPYRGLYTGPYHKEGCRRWWNTSTKEILEQNGRVCGVRTVAVKWKNIPNQRPMLIEVGGFEQILPCDLVIISLGLVSCEWTLIDQIGLRNDEYGNIWTDENCQTSNKQIFACGDGRSKSISVWGDNQKKGQSEVSIAMQDGIRAANKINSFLLS